MADWFSGFDAMNSALRFRRQMDRQKEQDEYGRTLDEQAQQHRDRLFDIQEQELAARQKANQALENYRTGVLGLQEKQHSLDIDQQQADQYNKWYELSQKYKPVQVQPPSFEVRQDPDGNDVTFLRTPKADGAASYSVYTPKDSSDAKALTAEELKRLDAIRQAKANLRMFQQMYGGADQTTDTPDDSNMGGPISGRFGAFRNAFGWTDPKYVRAQGLATAAVPNLARGVFGEVGVLTDKDVARYQGLVPTYYDTASQRAAKLKLLEDYIRDAEMGMRTTYQQAGRDVRNFVEQPQEGPQMGNPRFDSVEEAVASGATRAEVWDPQLGKYRLWGKK